MKRISFSVIAVLLLSAATTLAGPFYDFKIVAKTGDIDGFPAQSFKSAVSINDNGRVAFIAQDASGRQAAFVAEPSGNTYIFHKLAETSSGGYGGVRLNNQDKAALSFRTTASGVTSANVRRYEPTGAGGTCNPVDIVKATTARYTVTIDPCLPFSSCPFTYRFTKKAFDSMADPSA